MVMSTKGIAVCLLLFSIAAVKSQNCDPSYPYRTFDGTCNNLNNPLYGAAGTIFQRLLPANYADGAGALRVSQSGSALPSPRLISTTVTFNQSLSSPGASLMMMAFGQLLDHDMTRTAPSRLPSGAAIPCCDGGQTGNFLASPNQECLPITIPDDDPVFKPATCMTAVRSLAAKYENGTVMQPREQINLITHWIDGSFIYGSSNTEAQNLRDPSSGKGQLKVSMSDDGRVMLPVAATCCPAGSGNTCDLAKSCFFAGDSRVREQPLLTVQHLLWVREHNRVANEIAHIFPDRTDEFYFQEARRIVVAEFQKIVYDEWLPVLIGKQLAKEPTPNTKANEIPANYNEFAAAAFRMGHSMIRSFFSLYEADNSLSVLSYFLRDAFSKAGPQVLQPRFIDNAIRGLLYTPVQSVDECFADDITSFLYKAADKPLGLDLVALNINRGRDHGLPAYVVARADAIGYFEKRAPPLLLNEFDQLIDTHSPEVIASFKKVYSTVRDIDLFIGAVTEKPLPGMLLGPTFASIIARQFETLRRNDRFFYTKAFKGKQKSEIKKSSLARILCDNSDGTVTRVQKNAFLSISMFNRELLCNDIPKLNMAALFSAPTSNEDSSEESTEV